MKMGYNPQQFKGPFMMLTAVRKTYPAVSVVSTVGLLWCLALSAHAQSRIPNPDAPATLRSWPQTGGWETFLARSNGQTLICSMISGKVESGRVNYLGTLTRWPTEWHIGLADVNQISGTKISLVVDGVRVGEYAITKRQDNGGPLHSVGAIIPNTDTARIMSLFRTGATVQFVTDQLTYTFPLAGAAQSLSSMQSCIVEANNLTQPKTGNR